MSLHTELEARTNVGELVAVHKGTNIISDKYSILNALFGEMFGTFLLCYVWASTFDVLGSAAAEQSLTQGW